MADYPGGNWYPDPQDSSLLRWWDGTNWTGSTRPNPAAGGSYQASGSQAPSPGWQQGATAPGGTWQQGATAPGGTWQQGAPGSPIASPIGSPIGTPGGGDPGGPPRRSRLPWILGGAAVIVVIVVVVVAVVASSHGIGSAPTAQGSPAGTRPASSNSTGSGPSAGLAQECQTVAAPLGTGFLSLGQQIEADPGNADATIQSQITAFSQASTKAAQDGYPQLATDLGNIAADLQAFKADFDSSNPAGDTEIDKMEADAKTLETLCGFPTS